MDLNQLVPYPKKADRRMELHHQSLGYQYAVAADGPSSRRYETSDEPLELHAVDVEEVAHDELDAASAGMVALVDSLDAEHMGLQDTAVVASSDTGPAVVADAYVDAAFQPGLDQLFAVA